MWSQPQQQQQQQQVDSEQQTHLEMTQVIDLSQGEFFAQAAAKARVALGSSSSESNLNIFTANLFFGALKGRPFHSAFSASLLAARK